ncbi:fumarylacetoacetate hydrolase family protein [Nitratireductor basaltis]|uniref:Fumarylacetoacetate (FAA) hydrolase family protein n=1 Tax=Nitratireductor basaltis TaxID=472175 RepID=A0A084U8I6_9HYPH|nr:fumarylacetoacetate hydrolase family protein [Nitratireductor basaltis]KFB09272.1 Fumarylacetoacetate (FAA) hydrolase family protein [Nitratireductor basaltis]
MLENDGVYLGRVWRSDLDGPSIVTLREGRLVDITSRAAPTSRDIFELADPVAHVRSCEGEDIGGLDEILENSRDRTRAKAPYLLAPIDLQAVKACGVTFARSMIERVIEERAAGDASAAGEIRKMVGNIIGDNLRDLVPGSPEAMQVKKALVEAGLWSQYLEVGIGPDAEVFTKSQAMSSVGWGAEIGIHPVSSWNNPEPEVVLVVASDGTVKGATLGNDVNLRDVEGRSALLLGKAKDNNASSAIGPFIRLFDESFTIDDVRAAELDLLVEGEDGYRLEGRSSMKEISRDPLDLVAQTVGRHHQYPDGFVLYLGTLFAPIEDRDTPGGGFTHKVGDRVIISNPQLGRLENTVRLSTECAPWTFGTADLMRSLARRDLI